MFGASLMSNGVCVSFHLGSPLTPSSFHQFSGVYYSLLEERPWLIFYDGRLRALGARLVNKYFFSLYVERWHPHDLHVSSTPCLSLAALTDGKRPAYSL